MFIAVDQINEELNNIISYVSSRGSGLRLEALEFDLHQSGNMEILVPRRYGQLSSPTNGTAVSKRVRTIDEILTAAPDDKARRVFSLLVALWQEAGHFVKPGTVGASFQARIGDRFRAVFWAYPDNLQNAFSDLSKYGVPEEDLKKYRETVAKLPGFNHADVLSRQQPITKFSSVSQDTARRFVALSTELVETWRSTLRAVEA